MNAVKGYTYQIRARLQLKSVREAARVLQSAPMSLVSSHAALSELAGQVRVAVKDAGNAAFKGSRHDEAIEL